MTTKDQAKALAATCAKSAMSEMEFDMDFPPNQDDARKVAGVIAEHCCLVEFFAVARAAQELVGGPHRHVKDCNCEHCTLLKALAALRGKLPKGVL